MRVVRSLTMTIWSMCLCLCVHGWVWGLWDMVMEERGSPSLVLHAGCCCPSLGILVGSRACGSLFWHGCWPLPLVIWDGLHVFRVGRVSAATLIFKFILWQRHLNTYTHNRHSLSHSHTAQPLQEEYICAFFLFFGFQLLCGCFSDRCGSWWYTVDFYLYAILLLHLPL